MFLLLNVLKSFFLAEFLLYISSNKLAISKEEEEDKVIDNDNHQANTLIESKLTSNNSIWMSNSFTSQQISQRNDLTSSTSSSSVSSFDDSNDTESTQGSLYRVSLSTIKYVYSSERNRLKHHLQNLQYTTENPLEFNNQAVIVTLDDEHTLEAFEDDIE